MRETECSVCGKKIDVDIPDDSTSILPICKDCINEDYPVVINKHYSQLSFDSKIVPLRKYPISDDTYIAGFILLGDAELTRYCAENLVNSEDREYDVILTAEAKSIGLVNDMSLLSGKPYVVARKSKKVYMTNPVEVEVNSITTQSTQRLYLGEEDAEKLRDKKVLIVDDVISTGESLNALKVLLDKCGGNYVGCSSVLVEGDKYLHSEEAHFLGCLPLFKVGKDSCVNE